MTSSLGPAAPGIAATEVPRALPSASGGRGPAASVSASATAPPRDRRLRLMVSLARLIRAGRLAVELPDGSVHEAAGTAPGPSARIAIHGPRLVRRLLFRGSLGFAEAYMDGDWSSPDLRALKALVAANEHEFTALFDGRPLARFLSRLWHALRPNTRRGARRNIAEHYDLGNAFYALWLDPTMTYSSALFERPGESLEQGQLNKIRRLCREIGLAPGKRVLEIGCGWGGFAEVAAAEFGAHVVGLTLSREQFDYARKRIARAGLAEKVEFRLEDYRDTRGAFDAIASIEMFEAVGERYWPAYFRAVHDRLKPGGLAGLQIITIEDDRFPVYRRSADFIQRYVFPGGMLPCPAALREQARRARLDWIGECWFAESYADTLALWFDRFQAAWPEIARDRQFDTRFKRLWEFYLAYCEIGFRARWTDVGQIMLGRS